MSISQTLRTRFRREPDREPERRQQAGWRGFLGLTTVGAFVVTGVYANRAENANIGIALLLAGGCLLVGGLVGFLFGIPKSLQKPSVGTGSAKLTDNSKTGGDDQERRQYQANTNLEEVSDWLTKILVGVGLTQITSLESKVTGFGQYFGPSLGGTQAAERFAVVVLLFFAVDGFLFGYLWTRLFLGGALAEADALGRFEKRLDAQELQMKADATALLLTERYLRDSEVDPSIDQSRVKDAIRSASEGVKGRVFYQAEEARRLNWREQARKPLMERTIPIFQALIEADKEQRYHKNFGQLGFALKDQREPDWKSAEKNLSIAIRIRGNLDENGWPLYEFNRAICRIETDANFARHGPSSDEAYQAIQNDLDAAAGFSDEIESLVVSEPTISDWRQLNPLRVGVLSPPVPVGRP